MTRVLLADDHAFIRAGVESVLAIAGYEVVTAVDGLDAIETMARLAPQAVILDVVMPRMSGLEVLQQLRRDDNRVPVVLLSANLEDRDLLTAITAGVDGIVLKDDAADRLVACLEAVLRGERYVEKSLIERALAHSLATPATNPLDKLAPRERDIALAVAEGLRNRQIADRLSMSEGTVKVYLYNIYQRLGVANRTGLALLIAGRRSGTGTR